MKRSAFLYKQAISQYWLQTLQLKTNSYKLQHVWYILEQKLYWLVEIHSTLLLSTLSAQQSRRHNYQNLLKYLLKPIIVSIL